MFFKFFFIFICLNFLLLSILQLLNIAKMTPLSIKDIKDLTFVNGTKFVASINLVAFLLWTIGAILASLLSSWSITVYIDTITGVLYLVGYIALLFIKYTKDKLDVSVWTTLASTIGLSFVYSLYYIVDTKHIPRWFMVSSIYILCFAYLLKRKRAKYKS